MQRTLKEDAERLAQSLEAFYGRVQAEPGDEVDPAVVKLLAAHLCRLTRMIIPDVHQKIDEIIYADENRHLEVQAKQHGADLKSADGARSYELKVSRCTARSPKVNFNWPVPADRGDDSKRRERLLNSIREKTSGGGAILRVVNGKNVVLKEYELCGTYLVGYFARLKLGKCTNHNMGCAQCAACKSFHRLDRMKYVEEQVRRAKSEADLALVDWTCAMYKGKCRADN